MLFCFLTAYFRLIQGDAHKLCQKYRGRGLKKVDRTLLMIHKPYKCLTEPCLQKTVQIFHRILLIKKNRTNVGRNITDEGRTFQMFDRSSVTEPYLLRKNIQIFDKIYERKNDRNVWPGEGVKNCLKMFDIIYGCPLSKPYRPWLVNDW